MMARIVVGKANGARGTSVVNRVVSQEVPTENLNPTQFLVHRDNLTAGSSPRNPILAAKNFHGYSILDGHHKAWVDHAQTGRAWIHQEADSHGKYIEPGEMADDHTRSNVPPDWFPHGFERRRTNPHDMQVVEPGEEGMEMDLAPLHDESQHDAPPFWRA